LAILCSPTLLQTHSRAHVGTRHTPPTSFPYSPPAPIHPRRCHQQHSCCVAGLGFWSTTMRLLPRPRPLPAPPPVPRGAAAFLATSRFAMLKNACSTPLLTSAYRTQATRSTRIVETSRQQKGSGVDASCTKHRGVSRVYARGCGRERTPRCNCGGVGSRDLTLRSCTTTLGRSSAGGGMTLSYTLYGHVDQNIDRSPIQTHIPLCSHLTSAGAPSSVVSTHAALP
jgi:hypothetical protein